MRPLSPPGGRGDELGVAAERVLPPLKNCSVSNDLKLFSMFENVKLIIIGHFDSVFYEE